MRSRGLFPGSYLVSARASGFTTLWYPSAAASAAAKAVKAVAQTVTDGVNLTITGDPAVINGKVDVGDVTTPVVTTVVARATWARDDAALTRTVKAAADGTYSLPDVVAPGTYELSFTAKGYQPATLTETVTGGQTRFAPSVTLQSGAGQISGMVTDGSRPLGGVVVTTTVAGAPVVVGTPTLGAVGTFVIPGLPTPGTYVVTFTADGFTPSTVVVDLTAGESKTGLTVAMTGGAGTVTGRVLGPDGNGLGRATVTATGGPTPVTGTSLTTGTVGTFTLAGLKPGLYTLMVTLAGYAPQSVAVDLSTGVAPPVTVTMRPSWGTVQGVVRAGAGAVGDRRRPGPGDRRPAHLDDDVDRGRRHAHRVLLVRRAAAGRVLRDAVPGRPGRGDGRRDGRRRVDRLPGPDHAGRWLRCASTSPRDGSPPWTALRSPWP